VDQSEAGDYATFVRALASDSSALASAAVGSLTSSVPFCPGWQVGDVIGHLGGVYSWATSAVEAAGERPSGPESPPDDPSEVLAWFGEKREALLASFESHRDSDPAWVFISASPQTAGWWVRRQAFETAIHLFDVESAAKRDPSPVDPAFATEGVDEFLTQQLPRLLARAPVEGLHGTFHLHATDAPGEWSLDFSQPSLTRREHSKADSAVRGPAGGLFRWIWNRQTPEEAGLEVFGDPSVVAAWREVRQ
jgi:uncharacterized protein (TIGR03083 family)